MSVTNGLGVPEERLELVQQLGEAVILDLSDVEIVERPAKRSRSDRDIGRKRSGKHKLTMTERRRGYVAAGKSNAHTNRRVDPRLILQRPILFIDGEGLSNDYPKIHYPNYAARHRKGGDSDSVYQKQDYVLLAVRGDDGTSVTLKNPDWSRLTTEQCLKFLMTLWSPTKRFIVGFGLNYDFSQILYDLPLKQVLRLKDNDSKVPNTAYYKRWQITMLPGRYMRVLERGKKGTKGKSITVWDTFTFFQSSFATAAEKCGLLADSSRADLLRYMKSERSNFTKDTMSEVEKYNQLELELGIEMFQKIRHHWVDLDLRLTQFHGAGAVAGAMLRENHVREYMDRESDGMMNPRAPDLECGECHYHRYLCTDIIARAYFGGRFDYSQQGLIGEVHEYDINSAYPFEATQLPCLSHARWIRRNGYHDVQYGVYRVRWDSAGAWAPYPYRLPNGKVAYYSNGEGYYYRNEVRAGAAFANTDITETWELVVECEHQPFKWVADYYKFRQELKRKGDYGEKLIKLGLNAIYGKLAQELGYGGNLPPYQNYIWAGMITSNTRARLMGACALSAGAITHMATDGIYSTRELPIDTDPDSLGAWEHKEMADLILVCNGMYSSREKTATRGYAPKQIPWESVRQQFAAGDFQSKVDVDDREFVALASVIDERSYERRCTWKTATGHMAVTPPRWKVRMGGWLYPAINESELLSEPAGK